MTKELKEKIYDLISDNPSGTSQEIKNLTNKISKEVDEVFGEALIESCQFGEICEAVGLQLVSKDPLF